MKVEGIVLEGDMERCIYAAAYGAEFSSTFDSGQIPGYAMLHASTRAATRARQAVEAFRKMREDVR